MKFRIEILPETKLIGVRMKMSFANNKTAELWKSFMPRRNEVGSRTSIDFFSMQKYGEDFSTTKFNPNAVFEKWAAVEVNSFDTVPEGMEAYTIKGGKYVVFHYIGAANGPFNPFQYIFQEWLPQSGYQIDNREHFEVLGEGYNPTDPNAEEDIWIPIK